MVRVVLLSLGLAVLSATAARAQTPLLPLPEPSFDIPGEAPFDAQSRPPVDQSIAGARDEQVLLGDPYDSSGGPSEIAILTPFEEPLVLQPTFQLRGRIEVDGTMSLQSPESEAIIGDLQNAYGFRRVRIGAQGNIGDAASWVSEVELAGGTVRLRDTFIGFDAFPGVRQVRVGHFREPYSLEGMTSSNFITLMERAPSNSLTPARNWGICGYWWLDDERILFSLGAFRDGTPSSGQSVGDGDNWAYTARLTGLPIDEMQGNEVRLVHLGGAFSQRVPEAGVINFSPRTGSSLLTVDDNPGSPFLSSVDIPADSYQLYNLQAASVFGSLSLQAEWNAAAVQQSNAGLIFVHGSYLTVSYFLTGEHRTYNRTRGSFDRVDVLRPLTRSGNEPRRGPGAFEVAARFSFFDFSSSNLPLDANGDRVETYLYDLTLGLNWYLNSYTRIMFDYTAAMPDKIGFDPTVAHLFGVRSALYW